MSPAAPGIPPLSPSREEFRALAAHGNLIPVYAELAADLDTPLSAYLRLRPGPYAFLLESVEGGEKWARYSFLGSDPLMVFTAKGNRITLRHADGRTETLATQNPLEGLRGVLSRFTPVAVPGLPRFQGGAVGFFSYDIVRHVERLPRHAKDDLRLPDAVFMLTDTLLVFDNLRHRLLVIANAHVEADRPGCARSRLRRGRGEDRHAAGQARAPGPPARAADRPRPAAPGGAAARTASRRPWTRPPSWRRCAGPRSTSPPATPTRWCSPGGWTPRSRPIPSRSTARCAPSIRRPTSSSCAWARRASSAPRPRCWCGSRTAGWRSAPSRARIRAAPTRPRTRALADKMTADPKERAEHVMLVDLGRNDVGRVARIGTVEVTEFMVVERYSHVMHLVSHVRGQLAAGKDAFDVLAACFPAGTLSRRAQGAGDGDHRGAGAHAARPLRRRGRLHLLLRQHGLLHHHPHRGVRRPPRLDPGGRGHRGRLRPQDGMAGDLLEGAGHDPGPSEAAAQETGR